MSTSERSDPPEINPYCELCGALANFYCHSDEASLCHDCDIKVHSANFLVTRHVRNLICVSCSSMTKWSKCGIQMHNFPSHCEACQRSDLERDTTALCVSNSDQSTMSFNSTDPSMGSAGFLRSSNSSVSSNLCVEPTSLTLNAVKGLKEIESRNVLPDLNEIPDSPSSVLSSDRSQTKRYSPIQPSGFQKKSHPSFSSPQECSSEESSSHPSSNKRKTNSGHSMDKSKRFRAQDRPTDFSPSKYKFFKPNPKATGSTTKPLGNLAAARLQKVLSTWHAHLSLREEETKKLAFELFCRVLRNIEPCHFVPYSLRIILSACLWVSAKMVENQTNVPKASEVSTTSGVPLPLITSAEIQILSLLDWKILRDGHKKAC